MTADNTCVQAKTYKYLQKLRFYNYSWMHSCRALAREVLCAKIRVFWVFEHAVRRYGGNGYWFGVPRKGRPMVVRPVTLKKERPL